MLSRVAESLFWIGRYVERAEDTARLLDVHFHEALEDPGVDEAASCAVLLAVMGTPDEAAATCRDSRGLLELLGYDRDSPNSIVGALVAARQSARGAREVLSAEIWECLNSTHNALPGRVTAARDFGPAPLFSYVRERAATLTGYTESIITRDAGHDVLVLGRSLERVDMTARLLASRISAGPRSESWTATLRACSAQEAYLRIYQNGVQGRAVLEFLLADRHFPRSAFHALATAEAALDRLTPTGRRSDADEAARRALGRARTDLEFLSAGSLLDDLPARLHGLEQTVSMVNEAVTRQFFAGSAPLAWSIEEPVT
jgi:uncharacterized alpha-E superfamily protein